MNIYFGLVLFLFACSYIVGYYFGHRQGFEYGAKDMLYYLLEEYE